MYKLPNNANSSSKLLKVAIRSGDRHRGHRRVAVAVVQLHPRRRTATAPVVGIKDRSVAVEAPPLAELAIPGAVQRVEELRIVEGGQRVEVLVAEVAPEVVLPLQMADKRLIQQRVVEEAGAHLAQVQQQHARVVARKSAWRRWRRR